MSDQNTGRNDGEAIENASEIIERFGGIRPMASKMDVPVTTVQGWKKRNVIPANRRGDVIRAARANDVDLSDLVAGAANENILSLTKKEESEISENFSTENKIAAPEIAAAPAAPSSLPHGASYRPAETGGDRNNEDMLKEMMRAQSVTFTKSVWVNGALVAIVLLVCGALLWPSKRQIDRNTTDIGEIKEEMAEVRQGHSFLKTLIPGDFEQRLSTIQDQAKMVEEKVVTLGAQVDTIAKDVMDPNVPVATRLGRLGEHAAQLGAPAQLTDLLHRVRGLQESAQGQAQLAAAMAELNALFGSVQGAVAPQGEQQIGIDSALMQAQQAEGSALGETLGGIAPEDLKAAAMLLGLAQFRDSLNRNAPFETDLALMQKLIGTDDPALQEAVARLAPMAAQGILTPEGLKNEFKGLAGDIVVASLSGEDVSVQEKARARLGDFLSVEKDGALITGTDTQAKVARAQKMLDEGDIDGAIAELRGLEGPAAESATPFINDAQLVLTAQQLQGLFAGKIIDRIGASPSGASGMAGGAGASQLIGEIKSLVPSYHLVQDKESGFSILEPGPKLAP